MSFFVVELNKLGMNHYSKLFSKYLSNTINMSTI